MGRPYHEEPNDTSVFGARDFLAGIGTGLVAGVDGVTLGVSGRIADLADSRWYDAKRREPGFQWSRALWDVAFIAKGFAKVGAKAVAGVGWRYGVVRDGALAQTDLITGEVVIRHGVVGEELATTIVHEGVHRGLVMATPKPLRGLKAASYQTNGLHLYLEESLAELVATNAFRHSLAYPFTHGYVGGTEVAIAALQAASLWAGHRLLTNGLDSLIPPPPSARTVSGWTPAPSTSRLPPTRGGTMSAPSLFSAAGPSTWPTWSLDAPRAKPMDAVRSLFASRLTDAGRGLFGTQFGIDGLAVELTEGSTTARVEGDTVLLPDAPELRGGHLSLTRAAAQVIERHVDQTLREWSVHRWFGARLSVAQGVGDEARLTIDGVEVVLRHGQARATVAGRDVTLSPPPRRALNNMTLSPSAYVTLDLPIAAAKRAAQPEPAPQAALPPLWSMETAAPNSVFRQEPKTLFGSSFGLQPFGSGF